MQVYEFETMLKALAFALTHGGKMYHAAGSAKWIVKIFN